MKKQLELFKQSFKSKRQLFHVFLIDAVFVAIIALFYFLLDKFLFSIDNNFFGDQSTEQMKEFLVTASQDQLSVFFSEVKILIFSIFGSVILFVIVAFLLFTLSQSLIWYLITKKKLTKKKFFKWMLFILFNILIFAVTLVIFLVIKFLLIISTNNWPILLSVLSQIVNFIYFFAFLFIFFVSSYYFTQHQKVFQSLAQTFSFIKHHFKSITITYLLALILVGILTLILYIIFRFITPLQPYLIYFNLALSLLFLAWLRLYLVKCVN